MPSLEAGFKPPSPFEDDGGAHILRICQKRKKHTEEKNSQSHFATSCEDAQILVRSFCVLASGSFCRGVQPCGRAVAHTDGNAVDAYDERPRKLAIGKEAGTVRAANGVVIAGHVFGRRLLAPRACGRGNVRTIHSLLDVAFVSPRRLIRHNANRARG